MTAAWCLEMLWKEVFESFKRDVCGFGQVLRSQVMLVTMNI